MVRIAKPLITKADESPAYWQIGNLWQIMATGVQTDNAFTLLDQVVQYVSCHYHPKKLLTVA